jgi:oligopeptide/dipeptide ABC transporter ATP-binding protein
VQKLQCFSLSSVQTDNVLDRLILSLHPYTKTLLDAVPIPDPDHVYKSDILSGDIPSPVDPPKGCPFHPRCRESKPECSLNFPEWKEIEPEHFVSCHLY